ncbi:hypothetical protein KCP73_00810 [Salmonella enterica subsp. enterica]|nr:hypothetical protein KCP73_00810 [Salmonella enterica subsp. enterica]
MRPERFASAGWNSCLTLPIYILLMMGELWHSQRYCFSMCSKRPWVSSKTTGAQ